MSWFGSSSSKSAKTAAAAAAADTDPTAESPKPQQQQQQKSDTTTAAAAAAAHDDDLERILAGAPDNQAKLADLKKFAAANGRHTAADGAWALATYTLSGLQHVNGQSTALTLLSMWAAGTTFLVSAAMRKAMTEGCNAYVADEEKKEAGVVVGGAKHGDSGVDNRTGVPSTPATITTATTANNIDDGSVVTAKGRATQLTPAAAVEEQQQRRQQQQQLRSLVDAVDFDSQRRNAFWLGAAASWIWMLASLQQFKIQKRLKWCGYSSWMGLGCAAYYTFRHMYNVIVM